MYKLLFATTLLQSFCITTTVLSIRKYEQIFVPLFFGTMGVFTTFAQSFMTNQMASLYEASEITFHPLQGHLIQLSKDGTCSARKHVRLKRRIYKSYWMTKQKFDIANFIDRITPLNSVNTENNLTINVLLIK